MKNSGKGTGIPDDAFDDCLEMLKSKGVSISECLAKYPDLKDDLEPALMAAMSLMLGAQPSPDPAFRARVKKSLLSGGDSLRAKGVKKGGFAVRPFLFRVVAVTAAFALGLGAVGYAATDSEPDDPLYPVKQLIEQIRLAAVTDSQAEAELHLELAEERLAEAEAMTEEGKTREAREALNELNKEMREAYRLAGMVPGHDREILLAKFAVISQRHILVLEGVFAKAPDSARTAIENAIEHSQSGLDKASEAVMNGENGDVGGTGEGDEGTDGETTSGKSHEKSNNGQGQGQNSGENNGNGRNNNH